MITQVMSNLLLGFSVVLETIRSNHQPNVSNKNKTSLIKNNTTYKDKGTHNEKLCLKSSEMFQTSNLTED